jgi:transposase
VTDADQDVVRVPSVAEEDARRLHRERDRLVSERVQHVNRIKGLCALHGICDYQPLRPQAMARLEQLRTAQGISLPPRLKSEIKRELQWLELVVKMIATLEAERDAIVEDEASTHVNAKKIQNLHKLKAIGPEFRKQGTPNSTSCISRRPALRKRNSRKIRA